MDRIAEFKPGDPPSAARFNELVDAANGSAEVAGTGGQSEGLELVVVGRKRAWRARRPLEGWFKVTGAPTSGLHPATQQLETAAGTWSSGARTASLRETNGSTADLTNKIVRAWKDGTGRSWWFTYSACS